MLQRLAIARALVHAPRTVLFDEPFTGLDPSAAERLAERIEHLGDVGCTRLLVTHDLGRAAALCDAVTVLVAGRIGATAHGMLTADALGQAIREATA